MRSSIETIFLKKMNKLNIMKMKKTVTLKFKSNGGYNKDTANVPKKGQAPKIHKDTANITLKIKKK